MRKSKELAPKRRFQMSLRGFLILVSFVGVVLSFGGVALRNMQLDRDFEERVLVARYSNVPSTHLIQGGKRRFCSSCTVQAEHIAVLSQAPNLGRVIILDFDADRSKTIENIAAVGQRKVATLFLGRGTIDDPAVARQLGKTFQTEELNIVYCDMSADCLEQLIVNSNVQHLVFGSDKLSDEVFRALVSQPSLKSLSLGESQKIKPPPGWLSSVASLEKLELGRGILLDGSVCDEIAALKQLEHLSLARTNFDDSMIDRITASKSLRSLEVSGTKITDNGVDRLLALSHLKVSDGSMTPKRMAYRATSGQKHVDQKVPLPVYGATILSDGTYLQRSTLYNCNDPSNKRRLRFLNSRSVTQQCLSSDGDHIAVKHSGSSDISIYQISSEKVISVIPNASLPIDMYRLRRHLFCGGRLLIRSGGQLHVWDVADELRLASIPRNRSGAIQTVEISPDGSHLLVAIGNPRPHRTWTILDCKTGKVTEEFSGTQAYFNPLSEPCVTTKQPNQSCVYNVTNLATKHTSVLHCNWKAKSSNQARGLIFSKSGNRVLVHDATLHARVYDLTTQKAKKLYSIQLPSAYVEFINDDDLLVGEPER